MRALRTTLAAAAAGAIVWAGSFDDRVLAGSAKVCEIAGVTVMAFGTYDPMSNAVLDSNGSVSYRCYNAHPLEDPVDDRGKLIVEISLSQGGAGSFQRRMQGDRDVLGYNLYTDPVRTIIWGDGTSGTATVSEQVQPNNQVVTIPVFGRIPGGQDVGAGQYLDNLVVTVNF